MQHAATDGVPRGGETCGGPPRLLVRVLREGVPHQELLPHTQVQIPPPGEPPHFLPLKIKSMFLFFSCVPYIVHPIVSKTPRAYINISCLLR